MVVLIDIYYKRNYNTKISEKKKSTLTTNEIKIYVKPTLSDLRNGCSDGYKY